MTSTTTLASGIQIDPALQIRKATEPFEISQLRAVLDAEHDPEDGRQNPVAVLCWAGAAKRLKDRDTWISYD